MELGPLFAGICENELVRVRLLAIVRRLWGLAWPLVAGSDTQANESVPQPFVNGGHECDQKQEAASGAKSQLILACRWRQCLDTALAMVCGCQHEGVGACSLAPLCVLFVWLSGAFGCGVRFSGE